MAKAYTVPDATKAAEDATETENNELTRVFGRLVNGSANLVEDTSIPKAQRVRVGDALADLLDQGVLPTVATLTGQPDARLAISGGTNTPDPVTAPAAPAPAQAPTPNTVANKALQDQIDAVIKFVTTNGGTIVQNDIVASLESAVKKREEAAKTAATAAASTTVPAGMVKKTDVKKRLDEVLEPLFSDDGGFHKVTIGKDQVVTKANYDKFDKNFQEFVKKDLA